MVPYARFASRFLIGFSAMSDLMDADVALLHVSLSTAVVHAVHPYS
jgi:hypothetical protein